MHRYIDTTLTSRIKCWLITHVFGAIYIFTDWNQWWLILSPVQSNRTGSISLMLKAVVKLWGFNSVLHQAMLVFTHYTPNPTTLLLPLSTLPSRLFPQQKKRYDISKIKASDPTGIWLFQIPRIFFSNFPINTWQYPPGVMGKFEKRFCWCSPQGNTLRGRHSGKK